MVAKACVIVEKENRKRIIFISGFSLQLSNCSTVEGSVPLRKVMMASRIKEEAVLMDLLRWIETRDFNMTRRQMMPEAQEEAESEESVRWLSYILDNDETESGKCGSRS